MKKRIFIAVIALIGLSSFWATAQNETALTPKEKQGRWGYVSQNGTEVIPFKYEKALKFCEGRAAVQLKGKWGFIDENGNIVTAMYDDAGSFSEGLAAVFKKGKAGFIDSVGKVVIPLKYETEITKNEGGVSSTLEFYAQNFIFDRNVVAVALNGKFGLIDKKGNEITTFKYDEIGNFSDDGKALALTNGEVRYVDPAGTETEVKSPWTEMPIKYSDSKINILDMFISVKDNKISVTLLGAGLNPVGVPFIGKSGGLEFPQTPDVSIIVDGTEHSSREGAISGLTRSYYFDTTEQPDSVIIFLQDTPDSKITIHCANR
ncbi:MAG: WG repeat-containing protein [Prevotellaceae bacterium]|nr:WG repeat-containing protein [Prevotellaceae bacterium]